MSSYTEFRSGATASFNGYTGVVSAVQYSRELGGDMEMSITVSRCRPDATDSFEAIKRRSKKRREVEEVAPRTLKDSGGKKPRRRGGLPLRPEVAEETPKAVELDHLSPLGLVWAEAMKKTITVYGEEREVDPEELIDYLRAEVDAITQPF